MTNHNVNQMSSMWRNVWLNLTLAVLAIFIGGLVGKSLICEFRGVLC